MTPTATLGSEVGHRLLAERGMQWLFGHGGDPHALVLRDETDDPGMAVARMRALGPLHRARDGAWVSADPQVVRAVLTDPAVGPAAAPVWLPHAADLTAPHPEPLPLADPAADGLDLAGNDLVAPVRAAIARAIAAAHGVPAVAGERLEAAGGLLDALLCPPRLPDARGLCAAVDDIREAFGRTQWATAVIGLELATSTVVNTVLGLLAEPGAWAAVVAAPDRAAAGVESAVARTLRANPPLRLHARVALASVEIAGQQVAPGARLVGHVAHDPGADPDGPLALAGGGPVSAAAMFVQSCAIATVRWLAVEAPALSLDGTPVRRLRAPVTRAIVRCPVTIGPSTAGSA